MYKSQLQVLCQKRGLPLPVYDSKKEGPDHCARFTATVSVNGTLFQSPPSESELRSGKEAQNSAAKVAYDFLTGVDSSSGLTPPPPPTASSSPPLASSTIVGIGQTKEVPMQNNGVNIQVNHEAKVKPAEWFHVYKNRLFQYAQKNNLSAPVYSSDYEGPSHARQFIASVTIDGKTHYQCSKSYPTLKDAEHAAAKMALESLSTAEAVETEERHGLFKKLLRDLAQRDGFQSPSFSTNKSGPPHTPIFESTVEVGGVTYQGEECKTKRQSETSAARVAYEKLTGCKVAPEKLGKTVVESCSSFVATGIDDKKFQRLSAPVLDSGVIPDTLQNNNPKPVEKEFQRLSAPVLGSGINSDTLPDNIPKAVEKGLQPLPAPVLGSGVIPDTLQSYLEEGFQHLSAPVVLGSGIKPDTLPKNNPKAVDKGVQHLPAPVLGSGVFPDILPNKNPKPAENIEFQKGSTEASSTIVTTGPAKRDPQQKENMQSNDKVDVMPKGLLHMYKNRLQQYVQKNHLSNPAYASEFDGHPHCRRFKAKVTIDGITYECSEYYPTLKDSENAAAKVALESLVTIPIEENDGLIKTLLQELAQKEGYQFPKYSTEWSGMPHLPNFVSTVEVKGVTYQGENCKTKKLAETSAAKVAYEKLTSHKLAAEELGKCVSRLNLNEDCQNAGAKMTEKVHPKRTTGEIHTEFLVEGCSSPVAIAAEEKEFQKGEAEAEVKSVEESLGGSKQFPDSKVLIIHRGSCVEAPKDGSVLHDSEGWMALKVNSEQQV